MQSPHNVQLSDAQVERFACFLDDLLDAELKAVGVPLLARKRTELAAQDAIIGVVNVAVNDVARPVGTRAEADLPGEISDRAERIQILALEKPQRVGVRNAFARRDLVIEIAQLA